MLSLSRIASSPNPSSPFGLVRKVSRRGFTLFLLSAPALLWAGEAPGEGPPTPSEESAAGSPAQGEGRRILVASFENHSKVKDMIHYEAGTGSDPDHPKRRFLVDRYSETPRGYLEDMLTELEGVDVVERQRVDAMVMEMDMGDKSMLVDQKTAMTLGKLLGANTIVQGTIQDITKETREFNGNGIKVKTVITKASVRVRAIDIQSGKIVASKSENGEQKSSASQYGKKEKDDDALEAIKAAVAKLKTDRKFLDKLAGKGAAKAAEGVAVEFKPTPDNCDILIDGEYQDSSPCTLTLPPGKAVKVTIRKAGYEPWEATVTPRAGMRLIKPELARAATEAKPAANEAGPAK